MKITFLREWNEYRAKATVDLPESTAKQLIKNGIAVDTNAPKAKAKAVKHGIQ